MKLGLFKKSVLIVVLVMLKIDVSLSQLNKFNPEAYRNSGGGQHIASTPLGVCTLIADLVPSYVFTNIYQRDATYWGCEYSDNGLPPRIIAGVVPYCAFTPNPLPQSPDGITYGIYRYLVGDGGGCFCSNGYFFDREIQVCATGKQCPDGREAIIFEGEYICEQAQPTPNKNGGCNANLTVNPCNVATGGKFRSETDIKGNSLKFTRYYDNQNLLDNGMGKGWRSSYQQQLITSEETLILISGTGYSELWSKVNDNWVGNEDSIYSVSENPSGFSITTPEGTKEDYNSIGQIVLTTDAKGHQTHYEYDVYRRLVRVINHYGESLSFDYTNNKLTRMVTDSDIFYSYSYDVNDNLVEVIYPDLTPAHDTDNPRKIYHYENPDFPNHLTGITDENGDRYATFIYNPDGKVISSELGNTTNSVGQEKIELDYQGENN